MVVDIGGGTTDIAVVALGGMVFDRSVKTAGHHMDEAIIQYMRRKHGLLIGERTAEQVKIEIGSASDDVEELNMEVRGRCLREGRPRVVRVSDAEIRTALAEPLKTIVTAVREALGDRGRHLGPRDGRDRWWCAAAWTGRSPAPRNRGPGGHC
jgi:rod shape-determining protein MreB